MKKGGLLLVLLVSILTLSGCSVDWVKQSVTDAIQRVMQKDQANEQGFEVTGEMLTEHLDTEIGYLNLSKLWLTAIPDVCKLMKPEELTLIQFMSLAQNKIRIVDQDLSCLSNLRVLNLSYNDIVQVIKLGSLPKLQELLLHKNNLEEADAIVEMDLPALQKLNLAYNNLKKLTNLDRFKNLTVLELQHNALESIVGVENLEKLEELKLEFNKLKDLPFLEKLKTMNLQSITTEGNNLKDTIAAEAKALQEKYMKSLYPADVGTGDSASGSGE